MEPRPEIELARSTVQELCNVDTTQLSAQQLLAVLDERIDVARRAGDPLSVSVLQAVRRGLRSRVAQLH